MISSFEYIRLPQSQTKFKQTWEGLHGVIFFLISINFLTCNQIFFSFSLLHHSNGKGKARHAKDNRGFQERPKAGNVIAQHQAGKSTQPVTIDLAVRMEHDELTLL